MFTDAKRELLSRTFDSCTLRRLLLQPRCVFTVPLQSLLWDLRFRPQRLAASCLRLNALPTPAGLFAFSFSAFAHPRPRPLPRAPNALASRLSGQQPPKAGSRGAGDRGRHYKVWAAGAAEPPPGVVPRATPLPPTRQHRVAVVELPLERRARRQRRSQQQQQQQQ